MVPISRAPLAVALALALTSPGARAAEAATSVALVNTAAIADDSGDAADALPAVEVIGGESGLQAQAGSGTLVDQAELESSRTLSVNEALRKVPGVNVRDEEGFGMRPNIGVRGLNPTRSTKVLLLEDGLPAAYAPYGDNASYYHAPIERYARIEVMKGVGMLRFGPQTIGGVINYITPDPSEEFTGYAQLMAGNRGYRNLHLNLSGSGALLDLIHKEGDGARDHIALEQTDLNLKYVADLRDAGALILRANLLREDSQVTYSGLTDAELRNFGYRYNPFKNDQFDIRHQGASATHEIALGEQAMLTSSAYFFSFHRDWWRQSSTTTDTQCGNAFRDARLRGDAVDVDSCNSTQGRLRDYYTRGIEPRLTLWHGAFGAENELSLGLRYHEEVQERLQLNASTSTGRDGSVAERNRRTTDASSAFIENRISWGALSLVPALRFESIDYFRRNKLTGLEGDNETSKLIPGLGLNYRLNDALTAFAGVHRGFAPARAEDVLDNAGGSVDVDPESSTNAELGLRGVLGDTLSFEAALFRNDFSNQLVVGSIAGGSTPLAQGETLYQGAELGLHWKAGTAYGPGLPYLNAALTWLPDAEQRSPFIAVANNAVVAGSAPGRRLPYAPRSTATLRAGYELGVWDGSVEVQAVDDQFADFANTDATPANGNGQIGRIAGHAVWNATLNWRGGQPGWSAFLALKNAGDRDYIVDRTRGIQVGSPRQYLIGARYAF